MYDIALETEYKNVQEFSSVSHHIHHKFPERIVSAQLGRRFFFFS
jgi:hypothetical protein